MSVVAPPEPPRPDELEALIREARARRRRRLSMLAAGVLAVAGIGLALLAALSGGGVAAAHVRGHRSGAVEHSSAALSGRRGVGEVGSAGGVTWAISGHGFWLTTSGGRTWRQARLPGLARGGVAGSRTDPIANIADVQFVDRRHGWVTTTGRSRVYRTTDGGRTWHVSIPTGCATACEGGSIDFFDARRGYALVETRARDHRLFRTEDGGRTWQLVSRPPVYGLVAFVDGGRGFAFGGEPPGIIGPIQSPPLGYLYETDDGGRTWSRKKLGGSASFVEQPFAVFGRYVVVVQNGRNPAGGLNLAPGAVWVSGDGGRSWRPHPVAAALGLQPSFDLASPSFWVWPARQKLVLSRDGGRSWQKIALHGLPRRASVTKVDFTSSRVGWAIFSGFGSHGNLFRTTDGGRHWTPAGPRAERRRTR